MQVGVNISGWNLKKDVDVADVDIGQSGPKKT